MQRRQQSHPLSNALSLQLPKSCHDVLELSVLHRSPRRVQCQDGPEDPGSGQKWSFDASFLRFERHLGFGLLLISSLVSLKVQARMTRFGMYCHKQIVLWILLRSKGSLSGNLK